MHLPYTSRQLKSYEVINYATFDHFKIQAKKKPTNLLIIMLVIKKQPTAIYVVSVGRERNVPERSSNGCNYPVWELLSLGMNRLAPFIGKYSSRWEHNLSCQKKCHILCHPQTWCSCITQCMSSDKLTCMLSQN